MILCTVVFSYFRIGYCLLPWLRPEGGLIPKHVLPVHDTRDLSLLYYYGLVYQGGRGKWWYAFEKDKKWGFSIPRYPTHIEG